jgi:catechol 2,3-dioxygenase-like lactoylglutathione lyase family enzyme
MGFRRAMNPDYHVKRISPVLPVANMDKTLAFYAEVLGFAVVSRSPQHSIVERNGATLQFHLAAKEDILRVVHAHTQIHIEVDDIQSLWEHAQGFRNRHKIHALSLKDNGGLEFQIGDPNGARVIIAQNPPQS